MDSGRPATGDFGARLRGLRTSAGLSQEELAQAAGVSVRALSYLECGRSRGPQRRTVKALAAALRLDADGARELEHAANLGRSRPASGRPGQAGDAGGGSGGGAGPAGDAGPARSAGHARAAGAGPEGGPAEGRAPHPTPHHTLALPRDLHDFTARGPVLARLLALAEEKDPARPPVALICGQPGLGKTALAVHAAHTLAPRFPDGRFAVDLRGMDPRPTPPREALARLLRALGVPDSAVPAGTDDRSGLLRSVLHDRRALLLLDNAADDEQVRPLLPGTGASLTLVTSRHTLPGLESVHRAELGLLRREEAVELLVRVIGPERVERERQAARDLAELCGHLPLALRIAAQRLASRPGERIAKLVGRLTEEEDRLDALQAGSLRVRAAFALSYRRLSPADRLVLRRAALADGADFSPGTAALLAGLPARQATRSAERLADAGLLQPHPTADRYRFHDLLRLFAGEQLAEDDDPADLSAARERADRWILRRATATALLFDADHRRGPADDGDPDPATAPAGREQARTWLEAERAQWLAALGRTQAAGHHRRVLDAAEAMHWFSDRCGHWELWVEVFQRAVDSARALRSGRDEAVHLNYLAWAYNTCVYDHTAALATAQAAQEAAHGAGDQLQVAWALGYGADALHRLGRAEESITRLRTAAALLAGQTSPQSRLAELSTLNTLGRQLRQSGHADEALTVHRRSETICRAGMPGQRPELIGLYLASSRQHIGNDLAALRRWPDAEAALRYAVVHFEAAHMPPWSEPARLDLGIVLRRLGRHDEARETLAAAHDGLRRMNNPRQAEAAAELRELDGPTAACRTPPVPSNHGAADGDGGRRAAARHAGSGAGADHVRA
ncbi:helix-turn-helix domain-containing protein [Streptomyces sp. NPDC005435]|uniref:ATP-binding protein n=1 Tax=Streptomyces sp. NPDC005435 TaxID=3154464 RepID=UPI0034522CD4